ncbi:tumor necrosis factor-inducible gene 6 protein-like [Petromyzon marinus]|uniref:tumor necrosis factor-inducible gene 6 protein-like n=1 Tax=Petromyzon marinus TaxID=7757 RepID=UPI003F714C05
MRSPALVPSVVTVLLLLLVCEPRFGDAWGFRNGIWHNSIWLESAAGVYHREARQGRYRLSFREARAVCRFEGGDLATVEQLRTAQRAGLHNCVAGWLAGARVGYPIVKPSHNCGFGVKGVVEYGVRIDKEERWDAYCFNPKGKQCGGIFTEQQRDFTSPDYPAYRDRSICYWHIRVPYGSRVVISFSDFSVEEDAVACLADFLEVYDSYDDVSGLVGRFCGSELPEDIVSTSNVMTLKFRSDSSVTDRGFVAHYRVLKPPRPSSLPGATPTPWEPRHNYNDYNHKHNNKSNSSSSVNNTAHINRGGDNINGSSNSSRSNYGGETINNSSSSSSSVNNNSRSSSVNNSSSSSVNNNSSSSSSTNGNA